MRCAGRHTELHCGEVSGFYFTPHSHWHQNQKCIPICTVRLHGYMCGYLIGILPQRVDQKYCHCDLLLFEGAGVTCGKRQHHDIWIFHQMHGGCCTCRVIDMAICLNWSFWVMKPPSQFVGNRTGDRVVILI